MLSQISNPNTQIYFRIFRIVSGFVDLSITVPKADL